MIANVNLTDTFSTWFSKTNQVILFANQLNDTQNIEFTTINAAYTMANANYVVTNSAFGTVNAAWNMLNVAYITGNANYAVTNAAFNELNAAYTVINSAYTSSNANYVLTNSAFTVLNSAYTSSNANYVLTNSVFTQSNTDNVRLSAAYVVINSAYTVLNSAYTSSNADYVTTNSAYTVLNAAYTMANANYVVTNSAFGVVNAAFTQSNTDNVRLSSAYVSLNAAYVLTNSAFTVSNSGFGLTNATYNAVNSAFGVINAAYTSSNSNFGLTNATYNAVNSAFGVINAAYTMANANYTVTNSAFTYANASNAWANVTFVKLAPPANTPAIVQTISSDIYITGNLTVAGVTTQQGVQSLSVGSGSIILYGNLSNNLPPSSTSNASITVNRGSRTNAQILWNEPGSAWMFNGNTTNLFVIASNTDVANATAYCNSSFYTISNGTSAFGTTNAAFGVSNGAFGVANSAFGKANGVVQTAYVTHSVGGTSLTPTTNANTITITSSNNIVLIANATNSGIQITQAPSGVTAQSYGGSAIVSTFTVDTYGRIIAAANIAGANSFATIIASGNTFFANSINTSLTIGNSNGIVVTSNSTNNFINLGIQGNSGIVANVNGVFLATAGAGAGQFGSSGVASVTLDSFGRVTAVSTATYLSSAVTAVANGSGLTGGTITSTGTLAVQANSGIVANLNGVFLATGGIGAGTTGTSGVSSITTDAFGRVTAVGTASYVTSTSGSATNLSTANLTITGTVNNNANASSQTLTDAATISWDVSQGIVASITLGGNRTLSNPTNMKVGSYILHVYQDGTGSRTLTFDTKYKWPAGVAPTLTTDINAHDMISFVCDGTNLYGSWLPDVR